MEEAMTGSTRWIARARRASLVALAAAALAVVAPAAPARAESASGLVPGASSARAARLSYDVAYTLDGREAAPVDAAAGGLAAAGSALEGNASGVVLTSASSVAPLESGIRSTYVVHRYLQTTDGSRYVEDVVPGSWPAYVSGVSGAPISVQLDDDPQALNRAALGDAVEGFLPFVAEGNTYVTDAALPAAADGTVARPAASLLDASPVVAAGGETHVHLFYTRASYQLRVVAGEGVSSVAASGSGATSGSELAVDVRYGRPVAVSAALEGGYEDVRWEVQSGAATLARGEGATAVLEAMPAGQVTLVASASRAEYRVRLMGEGTLARPGSELDGVALADDRLEGVYTYRTGTDLVLPALTARTGRTFEGWAVSGHVAGAEPRVEQRTQLVDGAEVPYWVFVGQQSFGDVTLTARWDSQWHTLALEPAPAGVELSQVDGVASGQRRSIAVLSGVGVFRTDQSTLESDRIDAGQGNWLSGAELPKRVYTVAYDPAGGTIAGHVAGEVAEDTHEIGFVGYEGTVVTDGAARRALLIAAEEDGGVTYGRVTEDLDLTGLAGGDTVLAGVWNEAADAFALPEVTRPGYVFAGWYEDGVRRDLGTASLVPTKVRTELEARWSPVTYRVTYGNLDGSLVGDAVLDGGARLALAASDTVPGGGTGGHTTYTVNSGSWVLPEPGAAEAPAGYEFAGYILDVEDGALDGRLSSATGVVLAPVTHDGEGSHGGAVIGATSHANLRATATWRPVRYAVTLSAPGATSPAEVTTVYGEYGTKELYLERPASAASDMESPLAVAPLSGKVLDIPARSYSVSYAAGAGEDAVTGVPDATTVTRAFTGYWYTGADGVARRVIKVERRDDGTLVGVLDDEPFENVAEGQPRSARELVASWSGNVTLEGRWADDGASVALPVPERAGWSFDGWLLGGEGVSARVLAGGEDARFEPTGSVSALTLTAQWSSGPYAISYDLPADVTLAAALPSRYGAGEESFELPTPSRDGWRFVGWYGGLASERDAEAADTTPASTMTVDRPIGDLWFSAAWEPVGYRVWLALPASETTLVAGTADGWTAVSGADRAELAAPAGRGVLDVAAGKEALSEVLEAATAGTDSRLGTLAEASKFVTAWTRGYTVADEVKLPVPVKVGYSFAGWDLRLAAVDAAGKPLDANAASGRLSVRAASATDAVIEAGSWGDVVATPTWRRNSYRVSFAAGAPLGANEAVFAGEGGFAAHGSLAMEASAFVASYDVSYELPASLYERQHSVRFDANVTAAEEASVEAPGTVTGTWDFAGWRLPDGSVHRAGELVRNLATEGTAVVEATWEARGTVTLPAGPARAGWLFAGWSENPAATPDGANGVVLAAGSSYAPASNVTLYAVWERGYRVVYDLGATAEDVVEWVLPGTDASVAQDAARAAAQPGWPNPSSLSAAQLSAGEAVALYSPVVTGWRFLGWFEDGIDLGGADAPAVLADAADHVLVARWAPVTGTVVVRVRDYDYDEAVVHFSAELENGAELSNYTMAFSEGLSEAKHEAGGSFVTAAFAMETGSYDFAVGSPEAEVEYVGAKSALAREHVEVKEGETTVVEFTPATVDRLLTAASVADISTAADLTDAQKKGLYWLSISYRERRKTPYESGDPAPNAGLQEYGYPAEGSMIDGRVVNLNVVRLMRFPAGTTPPSA